MGQLVACIAFGEQDGDKNAAKPGQDAYLGDGMRGGDDCLPCSAWGVGPYDALCIVLAGWHCRCAIAIVALSIVEKIKGRKQARFKTVVGHYNDQPSCYKVWIAPPDSAKVSIVSIHSETPVLLDALTLVLPQRVLDRCQVVSNGKLMPIDLPLSTVCLENQVFRVIFNPLKGGASSITTFEAAQTAIAQHQAHFQMHPKWDTLEQFCSLFQKDASRGDSDLWRKLAAQWGIRRDKLQVLREHCMSQFLRFVNDHLQELPRTIDTDEVSEQRQLSQELPPVQTNCSQPASRCIEVQPQETTEKLFQGNKMSLLVQPGAAFDQKFLVPDSVIAALTAAGLVEEIATATASKKHYGWVPGCTPRTQWEMLLQTMPCGKQRDQLERRALKVLSSHPSSSKETTPDASAMSANLAPHATFFDVRLSEKNCLPDQKISNGQNISLFERSLPDCATIHGETQQVETIQQFLQDSAHGLPLTEIDRKKIAKIAKILGVPQKKTDTKAQQLF